MAPDGDRYDLVVVGGGTAGLVSTAVAAGLGARVALVERDRLGGECLWTGCVPSKALVASAGAAALARSGARFGLPPLEAGVDTGAVLESVREARARIQPHDDPGRFRAMGAEVIEGTPARLLSPEEVEAGGRRLRARRIILATGSRPAVPPIEGIEEAGYITHEGLFDRPRLPGSLVVLGGGAVGVELAQAAVRLGVEVTLVEQEPRLLPREDADVSAVVAAALEEDGVRVLAGCRAVAASGREAGGRRGLELAPAAAGPPSPGRLGAGAPAGGTDAAGRGAPGRVEAEEILVAAGRRPNVEGLGLEAAGVEAGASGILVDGKLRTAQPRILAAGDVIGGLLFTHVADHEARTAVRNALFPFPSRVDYSGVPWAIFTDPEVGRVGPTEEEARERWGDRIGVHRYDLSDLDRAITQRSVGGLVKLVTDPRGRLLAGHVVGPEAGTVISEVALAVKRGLKVSELSELVHPYPTMSEGVRRAADAAMRARLTDPLRRWVDRWFRVARALGL